MNLHIIYLHKCYRNKNLYFIKFEKNLIICPFVSSTLFSETLEPQKATSKLTFKRINIK